MGTLALIGLGSNVGDRKSHLDLAVAALADTSGVSVRSVSSYHETAPAGGPSGQGPFLNAAARLDTDLDPFALLRVLIGIERQAGRVRTVRWGERPLDLDLLIYGCESLDSPELTLPHPRIGHRRFVLAPLAEIAPAIVDMRSGLSVAQLLANLDRRPSYVAIDAPPGPFRDAIYRRVAAGLPAVGLAESEIVPGPGPEWLEVEDARTHTRLHPFIEAKVRLLEARGRKRALGETEWLVTDFCLTSRTISYLDPITDGIEIVPQAERLHRMGLMAIWAILRRLQAGSVSERFRDWLLSPTFVVALPGGVFERKALRVPMPRKTSDVLLIPDSTDIEGIVHEILATCAATRA